MPPAGFASSLARGQQPKAAAVKAVARASSRLTAAVEDPQPVASIKEEASSSSSSEEDNDTSAAVRPLPGTEATQAPPEPTVSGKSQAVKTLDAQPEPSVSVKALVVTMESHVQQEKARSTRELKLFAVAKGLMATTISPRARSATTTNTSSNSSTAAVATKTATAMTSFGKFRRASTSAKGELVASPSTKAVPAPAETSQQRPPPDTKPQKTSSPVKATREHSDHERDEPDQVASESSSGHDFVDDVHETLNQLVTQLDSVDPKKLCAIRLGGELRGLLGKAQDEFGAYEDAFIEHAAHVGVSIALQNFSASLVQVFAIVARLQTAKSFLLNKKFKREVLFAFQEINSYYTSLFMELSMAVAKRSGLVLPLPSPVKPHVLPEPVEEEAEEVAVVVVPPEPKVEEMPAPPPRVSEADMTCLEAHQYFYGHRREKSLAKALSLYKQAAELGSTEAKTSLGDMFFSGAGVEKDLLVAETWLSDAASSGGTDACYLLGCLLCEKALSQHHNELKRRATYSLAMVRFTQAAENGHSSAQYERGVLYEQGAVGFRDTTQALLWYNKAAEQGHTAAEASLGRILYQGVDSEATHHSPKPKERDITQAIHFLQRAAAKNDSSSQMYLGRLFASGDSVKVDLERAIAFYRKSVEGGNCRAMLELAQLLVAPDNPDRSPASVRFSDREETHDEALRLLLNASTGGVTDAYFAVGELLEHSKFFKDKAAALRFYSKAANAAPSHAKAAKRVAAMHYSGVGTAADKWKAHKFYAVAANAGDAEALNALGNHDEQHEASAAEPGLNRRVACWLGLMFEEGEGCDLDFKQAGECYRRAVELRNPHAHFNLGCLLSQGKGVPRNHDAAQAHFRQALELGYSLARDFLRPTD